MGVRVEKFHVRLEPERPSLTAFESADTNVEAAWVNPKNTELVSTGWAEAVEKTTANTAARERVRKDFCFIT